MLTPDEFLLRLQARLADDVRVEAAWLAGSFGRGDTDRYSDIDLHLLPAAGETTFRDQIERWLNTLRPLVLYKLLFDGRMVNALTQDGVRLDIWLHDAPPAFEPAKMRLLFDRSGRLSRPAAQPAPGSNLGPKAGPNTGDETRAALCSQIEEFWRCIALLPAVLGRQEYIVAFRGLQVELDLLLDIFLRGYAITRDAGAKKLNTFLPAALRSEIESALTPAGLSQSSLAGAHLALAELVRRYGRDIAQQWAFDYPIALEEAVLHYVQEELALLS